MEAALSASEPTSGVEALGSLAGRWWAVVVGKSSGRGAVPHLGEGKENSFLAEGVGVGGGGCSAWLSAEITALSLPAAWGYYEVAETRRGSSSLGASLGAGEGSREGGR